MTSRERFEAWFRKEHPNDSGIAAARYCWQAAERDMLERCMSIVSHYQVSVGNSAAGEIACELTMHNIREIHGELKELLND